MDRNIKIIDPASPKAKGERLKRVRKLANLSREEMCSFGTINENTLISWETGRFSGLTEKGARSVVARVGREGVKCSVEWLFSGLGAPPKVTIERATTANVIFSPSGEAYKRSVDTEIISFQSSYPSRAFIHTIEDNAMSPYFSPQDVVGALQVADKDISQYIGDFCLAKAYEDTILLRRLKRGASERTYTLCATNESYDKPDWVIKDIELDFVAIVVRVWKVQGYSL